MKKIVGISIRLHDRARRAMPVFSIGVKHMPAWSWSQGGAALIQRDIAVLGNKKPFASALKDQLRAWGLAMASATASAKPDHVLKIERGGATGLIGGELVIGKREQSHDALHLCRKRAV